MVLNKPPLLGPYRLGPRVDSGLGSGKFPLPPTRPHHTQLHTQQPPPTREPNEGLGILNHDSQVFPIFHPFLGM